MSSAKIEIDGDAILAMLERDVANGSKPVTDFKSIPVPPVLDRVFAEVIREFFYRKDSKKTTGGGEKRTPDNVIRAIKKGYTEYIPVRSKSKDACLSLFTDRQFLGSGRYGDVYSVIDPSDKRQGYRYAVKAVFIHPFAHPLLYSNIVNEIEIGTMMGEKGVGPKVRAVHWCEQEGGVLVMIVADLMTRGDLEHFSQTHAITAAHVASIEKKVRKMHRLGYLHNDLHARNVLVTDDGNGGVEFFIGDYGFAVADGDTDKRKEEMKKVRSLRNLVDRDKLRGLLYTMMNDGRIKTNVRFTQTSLSSGSVWLSEASERTTLSGYHPQ